MESGRWVQWYHQLWVGYPRYHTHSCRCSGCPCSMQSWWSVNARHKASSAAPRHAAATSSTLHVNHTVIALVGMTVAIRTLWDKVLKLKKQGRALMLRMKIMKRMLRLRMLLKKTLLNLRILKMMNLNWNNIDDRCVVLLCVFHYKEVKRSNYTYTWPITPKHDPKL